MRKEYLNRAGLKAELECNNGDVKMYWAELKTLGWNIFMVGILHNISTPYHDVMNLVLMMITVMMTNSNSQGNNNNHTQPVVNRLTLLLNCELFLFTLL